MSRAELGRRAELAVGDYLVARGFEVVARNFRVGPLELDLIARRETLLVVVEVRTRGRGSYQTAFESISQAKRTRVLRAVDEFWRTQLATTDGIQRVRVDAAAVTFDGESTWVEYVEGGISG